MYKLREERSAGVTVLRGTVGSGAANQVIHTANILRLSNDLPIIAEVVDNEEEISKAADIIKTMLEEAKCGVLMTMEDIEILRYSP